jgi:hypothetical protein
MLTHFVTIPPMGVWNMDKEEEEEEKMKGQ